MNQVSNQFWQNLLDPTEFSLVRCWTDFCDSKVMVFTDMMTLSLITFNRSRLLTRSPFPIKKDAVRIIKHRPRYFKSISTLTLSSSDNLYNLICVPHLETTRHVHSLDLTLFIVQYSVVFSLLSKI